MCGEGCQGPVVSVFITMRRGAGKKSQNRELGEGRVPGVPGERSWRESPGPSRASPGLPPSCSVADAIGLGNPCLGIEDLHCELLGLRSLFQSPFLFPKVSSWCTGAHSAILLVGKLRLSRERRLCRADSFQNGKDKLHPRLLRRGQYVLLF